MRGLGWGSDQNQFRRFLCFVSPYSLYNPARKSRVIPMTESESNRIVRLETSMQNLEKKVDEGFLANSKANERMEGKIDAFIERSERVYAAKWVEEGAKWALGIVIGAFILALTALVIHK